MRHGAPISDNAGRSSRASRSHRAERGDKEEAGFVDRQIDQRPAAGRIVNFKPPFVWIDVDVAMRLSRHMAMASNAAAEGGV